MFGWLRKRTDASRAGRTATDDVELFDEEFQRRLEYLSIVARRAFAGRTRAERRSKKTGSGIEFADHREYVAGDDFRYLDWNVYQRLDKLWVRLYEEEEDLSVYVLLDVSRSMSFGSPSKLQYGKRLAAALAYIALANLDRVSVLTFADSMRGRLPPTRGKNRIFKVFEFLRNEEPGGETHLQDALRTFTTENKRRGVAALISDLCDPAGFEAGINTLRYAKFEPYVIQLVDAEEANPSWMGDIRLIDDETEEWREVTITPKLLDRYTAAHRQWVRSIEEFCTQKQVPYFRIDTSTPFDEAILNMLRRGGMVG